MFIYSCAYLFKRAVIIYDYRPSSDTKNDEQWIGSNAPANITVQFHLLPRYLTGHQNENHAERRVRLTPVEIRTAHLLNTHHKSHSLSQLTVSFVFSSQHALEVFKTFFILSQAERSNAHDNRWSPAEWCLCYMQNVRAGKFAELLRRTSARN
jgi:hypothetical protein